MIRYHTISYLRKRLKESGLPHNKRTILRWEEQGWLVCPKSPTNIKVIMGKEAAVRQFTKEQVDEIIKAFSPGGTGRWSPLSDGGS